MLEPRGKWAFFFDLDGTVMRRVNDVDPAVLSAFHWLRAVGHHIILATGRAPASIPRDFLDAADAAVTLTGALCTVGGETVYQAALPAEVICSLAVFCQREQIPIFLESARHFCAFGREAWFQDEDAEFYQTATLHLETASELEKCGHSFAKAAIGAESYRHMLEAGWDPPPGTEAVLAGNCIDMIPAGVDKGSSVPYLLKRFGIAPHRSICFGDSDNDLALFRACALRIAVGDRSLALSAEASCITGAVEERGVIQALQALGFLTQK